jgi:N-acyl-D-amino-acid deacylase
MSYDLVIRNGMILDGSGGPAERADVGVRGGRIVNVGRIRERADRVIDAEGHAVTPGFIDGHTHMDAQVMWDELGSCSCYHGVTSVVMGNCGFTLAPARPDQRALVVRSLERAEDISLAALNAGIDWTWETFPEYLEAVDRRPKGINYAAYIGHSALRTWAMGERAFTEVASEDDLRLMERSMADALRAGAIGFTTSRNDSHLTSDDRPVASRMAIWDEVRRLVSVMGDLGVGVFELSRETVPRSADPQLQRDSLQRLSDLAFETGVPVTFGAVTPSAMTDIESIVRAGGRAFGQSHSRGVTSVMSFRTGMPFDRLDEWKAVRASALADQRRALTDPEIRQRLIQAAHHGEYSRAVGTEARRPDYYSMQLYDQALPPHRTVAEVAAERGADPVELIIDLGLSSDFNQLFIQPITTTSTDDLRAIMKHPRAVMTFSDSGAHVSQISDCSIQTYLLSHWVRERQDFTLEEAVRMLTLAPATAWGFADRGLIREGFVADINVFDPDTITPELPTIATDLPGAAKRLVQKAAGFLATIVDGQVTLERGDPTGILPGRLLRGPRGRARPDSAARSTASPKL